MRAARVGTAHTWWHNAPCLHVPEALCSVHNALLLLSGVHAAAKLQALHALAVLEQWVHQRTATHHDNHS